MMANARRFANFYMDHFIQLISPYFQVEHGEVHHPPGRPHHASCGDTFCGRSFVFYNILALFRRY